MRHLVKLSIPAIAASVLLAACGSSSNSNTTSSAASAAPAAQASASSARGSSAVVKSASNPTLGTILLDDRGMTLYHLSGEQNGKFICTSSACVGIWHPLTVASGSTPSGEGVTLGTVKRPDGTTQVTYQGTPLYTFAQDQQPGESKGQGIKDVGTWSLVKTGSTGSTPGTGSSKPAESSSGGNSSGSGGAYGY